MWSLARCPSYQVISPRRRLFTNQFTPARRTEVSTQRPRGRARGRAPAARGVCPVTQFKLAARQLAVMPARRRSTSRQQPKANAKVPVGGESRSPAGFNFSFSSPGASPVPASAEAPGTTPKFSFAGSAAPVRAGTAGNAVFQFGASKFLVILTDDVMMKLMQDAGPRWSRLLGATCKRLHALSKLDELWEVFWMRRAAGPSFFPPVAATGQEGGERREAGEEGSRDEPPASETAEPKTVQPTGREQWLATPVPETGIAAAYAQLHAKPPPPRQAPIHHRDRAGNVTVLMRHIWCSKKHNNWCSRPTEQRKWAICGDDATQWCDWPQCPEARCPLHEYQNEDELPREDRDYKPLNTQTFARCSWCLLQACPAHAAVCGWRRCDLCQKSSCPDCVGEVHVAPTGICEFYTTKEFRMFPQRCAKFVCQPCARIVSKAGMFKLKVEPVPLNALAATNRRDRAYWQGSDSKRFPVVCCGPCSIEAVHRVMEKRVEEIGRRQEAAATMAAMALRFDVPDRCPFAFAIGRFHTVDSDGRAGVLHFGINPAGHCGGWWQFAPKPDAKTPEPGSANGQCEDEDESALEEEQDFIGLGPAWQRGRENAEYCQARTTRNAGGEPGKDIVELYATAAPGYCFQFRNGRNLETPGTLTLTRVEVQEGVLLKGELQVEEHRIYFTGAPLGGALLERDCTHDAVAIEAAESAAAAARLAVKRGRRKRMEALAAKYPAWGAEMRYEQGESSDSEIDALDENDIVPPWLREDPGAAQPQPSNGPGSDDY
eukprot:COSAG02_NODE_5631_length_4171_cov_4.971758_3_plen_773_part_00